jgi:hypothetical protein
MSIYLLSIWTNYLLTPAPNMIQLALFPATNSLCQIHRIAMLLRHQVLSLWNLRLVTKKFNTRVSQMSSKKGYVVPAEIEKTIGFGI